MATQENKVTVGPVFLDCLNMGMDSISPSRARSLFGNQLDDEEIRLLQKAYKALVHSRKTGLVVAKPDVLGAECECCSGCGATVDGTTLIISACCSEMYNCGALCQDCNQRTSVATGTCKFCVSKRKTSSNSHSLSPISLPNQVMSVESAVLLVQGNGTQVVGPYHHDLNYPRSRVLLKLGEVLCRPGMPAKPLNRPPFDKNNTEVSL